MEKIAPPQTAPDIPESEINAVYKSKLYLTRKPPMVFFQLTVVHIRTIDRLRVHGISNATNAGRNRGGDT